jgi:radical SAM superfamily enzyme YgiQ (UPF0313 family)
MPQSPTVTLVAPPTRAYSIYFSFALIYLAAVLEKNGISVKIIDLRPDPAEGHSLADLEAICAERILARNPDFVGFTCLTADYNCIDRIARELRAEGFGGTVIAGGHHPTFCPGDFFAQPGIYDYVVVGEGEQTLLELINCLRSNGDASEVAGLAYRENGSLHRTAARVLLDDIDTLPPPAYHLLDMGDYTRPTTGLIRHILISGAAILTTRGCPYKCTYCGNPSLWATHKYKKVVRKRSVDSVLDELELLADKYRIDAFYIADDAFTIGEDRVRRFCEGLIARKLDLAWACQTHVNLFTDNMARWMRDAGCLQVEFGVESGSDRVLKEMKKRTTTARIRRAFETARRHGLRTLANVMINTPTETERDLKKTVSFTRALKPTVYSYAVTVPMVGTEIYEKYVTPKLTAEEYSIYLDQGIYRRIVDRRFRLASHDKNIGGVYTYLDLRFMAARLYLDALFYFMRKWWLYRSCRRYRQYRTAIIKKYTAFNRLRRLVNRLARRRAAQAAAA